MYLELNSELTINLFKVAMQGFVEKIVNTKKSEKLAELQGGPVIMSQMENEYCKETMSAQKHPSLL